ncbi:unnamed protein product [Closterium sp. Naga37s-1]|nr:unnamed protein product [Closterium sp. Naga37s-1]
MCAMVVSNGYMDVMAARVPLLPGGHGLVCVVAIGAICLEGEAGPTGITSGLSAAVCGSKLSVQFLWSFSYWSAYFLTWVIIPIMQGYEDAGDFTAKERLRTSVRTNLMLIGIVGAVAVVGIIILLATKEMAWDNIVSLAIGASNAFALITGALLLGYGLVEIPRGLWSHADLAERHKWLSVRVARAAQKLDQAHQELSTAIVIAQATSLQMPRHDPLRPMMEIIDAMASEDAGFKPSGGQIGENDMDYDADAKSMAALRRRLRNAQDNYSRCKTEYCTVVWEALQLEETLHNCYQGTGRYTSYLRAPRKGFFAPLLDVVEWWWRCAIRSHVVRAFALLLGLISLAILFAEATLLSQKWVDLSLFSVLVRAAALHGEAVQLIVFVPLVYLCVCTYFSLFKLGMFSFYYLVPAHTDSVSLLINCSMVSRYAAPMCYNFLSLIHLRHYNYATGSVEPLITVFEKRMGVLPKSFDRVYPLCMVAWSLLIALNVHHRLFDSVTHLLSHCRGLYSRTWRRLRFDDDGEGEDVGVDGRRVVVKGHMILQRERATIERGLPVGESVVPLARHFSSKDLHASSSASSLLSGHYSTPTKVPHTDPSSSSSADPLLDSRLAAVRPAGGKPAADSASTKDPESASLLRAADPSSASLKFSGIIAAGAAAGSSAGGSARKPQRPPAGGASGASSGAASPAAGVAARVGLEASIKSSSAGDLLPLGREKSRQASVPGSPLLLSRAASPLVTARLPPISTSAHSTPHHLSTAVAAAPAGSATPTRPLSPPSLLSSALGLSSAAMVSTPQRYFWAGQGTTAVAAGAREQQGGTQQGSSHAVGMSPTESPLISGQRGAAGSGSDGTISGSSSHWSQTLLESRWSQAVTSRLRDASSSSTMGRLRDILGSPHPHSKDDGGADTAGRSGGGLTQETAPDLDSIFESLHARRAAAHTEDDIDDFEDQHGLLRPGREQQSRRKNDCSPLPLPASPFPLPASPIPLPDTPFPLPAPHYPFAPPRFPFPLPITPSCLCNSPSRHPISSSRSPLSLPASSFPLPAPHYPFPPPQFPFPLPITPSRLPNSPSRSPLPLLASPIPLPAPHYPFPPPRDPFPLPHYPFPLPISPSRLPNSPSRLPASPSHSRLSLLASLLKLPNTHHSRRPIAQPRYHPLIPPFLPLISPPAPCHVPTFSLSCHPLLPLIPPHSPSHFFPFPLLYLPLLPLIPPMKPLIPPLSPSHPPPCSLLCPPFSRSFKCHITSLSFPRIPPPFPLSFPPISLSFPHVLLLIPPPFSISFPPRSFPPISFHFPPFSLSYASNPYPIPIHPLSYPSIPFHTLPYLPFPSIPFHSLPYPSIPFHTLPFPSIPFHTYHSLPYPSHTLPYPSIPFHTLPFPSIHFHSLPFPSIPCIRAQAYD